MQCWLHDVKSSRFDSTLACDRQTQGTAHTVLARRCVGKTLSVVLMFLTLD